MIGAKTSALQRVLVACILAICAAALAVPVAARSQSAYQVSLPDYKTLAPVRVLGVIRRVFRSHRPPPPYVSYTIARSQMTSYGYPDYPNTYSYKVWCRTLDRAALARQINRDDDRGPLAFWRPAFNEPWDPGPPTADVFEPAPAHPHTVEWVPTPEPSAEPLKTIGSVVAIGESDYDVPRMTVERNLLHLYLQPRRDPERNRLREIWVDKTSYELRRVVAHDRLWVEGDPYSPWPVTFTYTLGYVDHYLVVTDLHGSVGSITSNGVVIPYDGDGQIVDYHFTAIQFPKMLPDWYFNPRQYAQHLAEAPT